MAELERQMQLLLSTQQQRQITQARTEVADVRTRLDEVKTTAATAAVQFRQRPERRMATGNYMTGGHADFRPQLEARIRRKPASARRW